VLTTMPH
jgi:hypothetical protein